MSQDKKSNTGLKVGLVAVVVGAAGYLAGILTAPKSGKETRDDLRQTAEQKRAQAEAEIEKLQNELAELLKKAEAKTAGLKGKTDLEKQKAIDLSKKAKEKAAEVVDAIKTKEISDPDLKKAVADIKRAKNNLAKYIKS